MFAYMFCVLAFSDVSGFRDGRSEICFSVPYVGPVSRPLGAHKIVSPIKSYLHKFCFLVSSFRVVSLLLAVDPEDLERVSSVVIDPFLLLGLQLNGNNSGLLPDNYFPS